MGRIKSWGRKTTSEDSQYQQPRVIGVLRPDVLSSYWRKFFFFFKSNKNEPPPPSIHQQHHPLLRHDEWNNEFRSSLRFMITPSKVWLSVFVLKKRSNAYIFVMTILLSWSCITIKKKENFIVHHGHLVPLAACATLLFGADRDFYNLENFQSVNYLNFNPLLLKSRPCLFKVSII